MSAMMNCFGADSLALPLAEQSSGGIHGVLGFRECTVVDSSGFVSCHFSPTHSPNPSLAPPGERGELHLAASVKVGTLVHHRALASKWPQRIDRLCKSISAPRQRALECLQQIEKPLNQFDGNVPMRTFFPPFKTRPNVAVGSPFRPGGGGEGLGERGGIQRLKNKKVAENRFEVSSGWAARVENILQKQEHITQMRRGLEARKLKNMLAMAQLVAASRELAQ
ncbi:hypothetical protein [Rhodoferax ferrireducens]|uniref:hypothetical protein n=1 Tax=Rhodoferax ferrireducens TaxID=192843 RepID=UPI00140FFA7D|nr:hypothetical protein [Rhodoferax ferrireducens]